MKDKIEDKNDSNPTNSSEFGDFEEIIEESQGQDNAEGQQGEIVRARVPRDKEMIGKILQRYGGNRMEILSTDGKTRNCRVPGKYKRRLWLRPGDIVLIVPWSDDDSKGDIIFKYQGGQLTHLKKKGILDALKDEF